MTLVTDAGRNGVSGWRCSSTWPEPRSTSRLTGIGASSLGGVGGTAAWAALAVMATASPDITIDFKTRLLPHAPSARPMRAEPVVPVNPLPGFGHPYSQRAWPSPALELGR